MDSRKLLIRYRFLFRLSCSYFWVYPLVHYKNLWEENKKCIESANSGSYFSVSHPADQQSIKKGRFIGGKYRKDEWFSFG
jgi:hypothetical protein